MRKTTKTVTEVTHEHGVISFEIPLYEKLLDIAQMDSIRDEHIDLIIEKTIKCTEEEDRARIQFALSITEQVNKVFQNSCTNKHS